ncbi:hypothetical protein [Phocaeicola vulgatus]|uniref:hypothetical protein n=1 Tax=Phocaeicola vulgatus TaxID=821 RepID=UPI00216593CC|nr:hypothetical protein [Phocaeicola vulgatus]MCS3103275.1 hypothetical protein [Phocaeicola vulgatus]
MFPKRLIITSLPHIIFRLQPHQRTDRISSIASNIMTVGVVKPQLNVYHSLPYSISLFFLQVKPFYTDMFYLQRPAEIKQAGRKALTIRQERVRDTDKIL